MIATPTADDLPREVCVLGAPHDVDEYAHELYRWLRDADAAHVDVVLAVMPDDGGSRRRGRGPLAPCRGHARVDGW